MKKNTKRKEPPMINRIEQEWHPVKNGKLTPRDVSFGSGKKIWWVCTLGHEWETTMNSRSRGSNCPYCAKRKVSKENSLFALNPKTASEWHPTKNGNLTSSDVVAGSRKMAWWKCARGHEWESSISSRHSGGASCPYCAGRKACKDNSFAALRPEVSKEWHPTKNGDLTPDDVTLGSDKKIWWKCALGHEWETIVHNRAKGHGCPHCDRMKVNQSRSLAKMNPKLSGEWHPFKNGDLTPREVSISSNKKVWWVCDKSHEWEAVIASRSRIKGTGCPHCDREKRRNNQKQGG